MTPLRRLIGAAALAWTAACTAPAPQRPSVAAATAVAARIPAPPPPAPLRRLTADELDHTLVDLLGSAVKPTTLARPRLLGVFDNDVSNLVVPSLVLEQLLESAEAIAAQIDPKALLPCDPALVDTGCIRRFIATFGQRAFRRPVTADEVQELFVTYDAGRHRLGPSEGFRDLLVRMLLSPHFLYRVEVGLPAREGPGRTLSPWELATRMSYFLWGTMPDEALFAAAASGRLSTSAQIEAQARRMLRGAGGEPLPRARATVASFHEQWLGLRALDDLGKNSRLFPAFQKLRPSMRAETRRFVDDLVWNGGTIQDLLTARRTFVDEPLAAHYGVPDVSGGELRQVELDDRRAGLLTQASLLSIAAGDRRPSPIKRGLFIRRNLICTDIPPPPAGAIDELPAPNEFKTDRERYEVHSMVPSCANCHRLMDELGFAFGHYDAIGAFLEKDANGAEVDTKGQLVRTDVDGSFTGAVELIGRLARSHDYEACLARHWYRFAFGRAETPADKVALSEVTHYMSASRGRIEEFLVALVTSPLFRRLPDL